MSLTNAFYWERLQPAEFINFCYDDKTIKALVGYFGEFPIILTEAHLPLLRSWAAIGCGRPLDTLIKVIEQNKEIRVWCDGRHWRRVTERERRRIVLDTRASLQPYENVHRNDDPYHEFTGSESLTPPEDEPMMLSTVPVPPVLREGGGKLPDETVVRT